MNSQLFNYVGWLAVVVALTAWGGFFGLVWQLNNERTSYASTQVALLRVQDELSVAANLHALTRDTKQDREALNAFASTDVLMAVDMIEKIGALAGTKVHVEGATAGQLSNNKSSKDVHAFLIAATTEGKLQSILRVLALLETLPFATSLYALELQQIQVNSQEKPTSDSWRLTVRVRIITTSPIGV